MPECSMPGPCVLAVGHMVWGPVHCGTQAWGAPAQIGTSLLGPQPLFQGVHLHQGSALLALHLPHPPLRGTYRVGHGEMASLLSCRHDSLELR